MTTHPAVEAAEAVIRAWEARADMDREIAALRATLPGLREAGEPAAHVAEVHMSRYTLEWTNGPLPEGSPLYAAPPSPAPQPDTVPVPTVVSWSGGAAPYRFVRLRLDDTPTEYEYVPAPQTTEPKPQCSGDPGECAFNGACMYRCGRPAAPDEPGVGVVEALRAIAETCEWNAEAPGAESEQARWAKVGAFARAALSAQTHTTEGGE